MLRTRAAGVPPNSVKQALVTAASLARAEAPRLPQRWQYHLKVRRVHAHGGATWRCAGYMRAGAPPGGAQGTCARGRHLEVHGRHAKARNGGWVRGMETDTLCSTASGARKVCA